MNNLMFVDIELTRKTQKRNFKRGLASVGEPTSGFFKLQKIRTDLKLTLLGFSK